MRILKGGVAFFDSGIGGLTVLAECKKALPHTTFYYYGDNGNAPYGNLTAKKITRLTMRAFRKIAKYRPAAAVVACNTATAVCVEKLRVKFPFPIVGTEPAVRLAAKGEGESFVLSTRATYESPRFQALLEGIKKEYGADVKAYPCDGLAGAIEKGIAQGEGNFSAHLPIGKPRRVVLGCTHYTYIKKQIADFYGCEVLDGNEGVARRLKNELKKCGYPLAQNRDASTTKKREKSPRKRNRGEKRKNPDHSQPLFSKKIPLQKGRIFFLGGHKKQNKRIYEQMFG